MKVLIINGSPRPRGNTKIALDEMVKIFDQEGIESEIVHIGNKDIRGCIACMSCKTKLGHCVFDDCVNEIAQKFEEADGLVVGTPVYYGSANATLIAFLTRLFYSTPFDKTMKVGASAVVARRGGISSTYDEINKFLLFQECQLLLHNIGILFMEEKWEKQVKMKKDYKQCVFLLETCHF